MGSKLGFLCAPSGLNGALAGCSAAPPVTPGAISCSGGLKGAHTASFRSWRGSQFPDFPGARFPKEGEQGRQRGLPAAHREGEGARDPPSDPSAWRGWRVPAGNGIMHAPAGRISPLAGQLNQTLSPSRDYAPGAPVTIQTPCLRSGGGCSAGLLLPCTHTPLPHPTPRSQSVPTAGAMLLVLRK